MPSIHIRGGVRTIACAHAQYCIEESACAHAQYSHQGWSQNWPVHMPSIVLRVSLCTCPVFRGGVRTSLCTCPVSIVLRSQPVRMPTIHIRGGACAHAQYCIEESVRASLCTCPV